MSQPLFPLDVLQIKATNIFQLDAPGQIPDFFLWKSGPGNTSCMANAWEIRFLRRLLLSPVEISANSILAQKQAVVPDEGAWLLLVPKKSLTAFPR